MKSGWLGVRGAGVLDDVALALRSPRRRTETPRAAALVERRHG
jgi:hypothetical protein